MLVYEFFSERKEIVKESLVKLLEDPSKGNKYDVTLLVQLIQLTRDDPTQLIPFRERLTPYMNVAFVGQGEYLVLKGY